MTLLLERVTPSVEALHGLALIPGPWASVFVDVSDRDGLGMPVERVAHWHGLALQLQEQGTPPEVLAALGEAVLAEPPGPAVLAALAPLEGPLRLLRLPDRNGPAAATYGPLPRLLPVVGWLQEHPPYLVVVTDRVGAEVEVRSAGTRQIWETVLGPDDEIERNAPGGWSQPRYQRRAEDSWRHNARRVAAAVVDALRESSARLVVVTGDVRAVQLLEERLPAWVQHEVTWRHVTGGRSPDGSQAQRYTQVDGVVRSVLAERSRSLLDRFAEQRGPGGTAVDGVRQVLHALALGEVGELLLVPEALPGRSAWFGPRATQVLPDDEERPDGWGAPAVRAPLADVAVRAALGTKAAVHLVPGGRPGSPVEGIGALCRFR